MLIHQALHGYNQGHNRLACSLPLSPYDDDRMKVISDWSEYTDNRENSYLTAYPLADANCIVVAKSWYADEMDRPGCVWTHSLIVNLASIDEEFDFRSLLAYFKRPLHNEIDFYSSPIEIDCSYRENFHITESENGLIILYMILLNGVNGTSIFMCEEDQLYYQKLCLTLLQYVPLAYLNTIGFCTGSAYGRKMSNNLLSLQFATNTGVKLSDFVITQKEKLETVCMGLRNICTSMRSVSSDTDQALRVFSSDIKTDMDSLCAAGLLLSYLDDVLAQREATVNYYEILRVISYAFPKKENGIVIKQTFCGKQVSNLFSDEVTVLSQLVSSMPNDCIDYEIIDYSKRVESLLKEGGIQEYTTYLKHLVDSVSINNEGQLQLRQAANCLENNDFAYIAHFDFSVYMGLVMMNPSILRFGFWIDFPEQQFHAAYNVFVNHAVLGFDSWDRLFLVILYRNQHISTDLMHKFSQSVRTIVSDVMEYLESSINGTIQSEIKRYCCSRSSEILEWIKNRDKVSTSIVRFVVETIDVKQVPLRLYTPDNFRCLYNTQYSEDCDYYIFLLVLAFRFNDKGCLPYFKKSFKTVHDLLSTSRLPEHLWKTIEPYTEKLVFLQEWDRCKKLRKGIVRYLKSLSVDLVVLKNFTDDDDLNSQLIKIWEDL